MPGTLRTAARVGATVLLVGLVAPFVVANVPAVVGADASYIVTSGSMSGPPDPDIRAGDVVIVSDVTREQISEGDIITFERNSEERITHRVVGITRTDGTLQFRTKGDANDNADPQPVTPDQVTGQVLFVIPFIGYVMTFGATTYGFVALVVLPLGLLLITEIWNAVTTVRAQLTADRGAGVSVEQTTGDASETEPTTVTLDRAQLAWAAVGSAPLSIASGYAVLRLQSAYTFTAAYATTGLFLLSSGMYIATGVWTKDGFEEPFEGVLSAASDSTESSSTVEQSHPRQPERAEEAQQNRSSGNARSTPPRESAVSHQRPAVPNRPTVYVESPEELAEIAAAADEWVVPDPSTGEQVVFLEDRVVRYRQKADETRGQGTQQTATAEGRANQSVSGGDTSDTHSDSPKSTVSSVNPPASGTEPEGQTDAK